MALFSIKINIFLPLEKMETVPKIEPIGTIRKNDLFQKKVIYFTFTLHKTSKIEQIKPHFFLSYAAPKWHSLQRKRVKYFLGLKNLEKNVQGRIARSSNMFWNPQNMSEVRQTSSLDMFSKFFKENPKYLSKN